MKSPIIQIFLNEDIKKNTESNVNISLTNRYIYFFIPIQLLSFSNDQVDEGRGGGKCLPCTLLATAMSRTSVSPARVLQFFPKIILSENQRIVTVTVTIR